MCGHGFREREALFIVIIVHLEGFVYRDDLVRPDLLHEYHRQPGFGLGSSMSTGVVLFPDRIIGPVAGGEVPVEVDLVCVLSLTKQVPVRVQNGDDHHPMAFGNEVLVGEPVAEVQGEHIVNEEVDIDVSTLDGMETKEILEQLKRKMQRCAKELQFEQAAILRDEIEKIKVTIK